MNARATERMHPRCNWLDHQSQCQFMRLLSGSRAFILPSLMEGGASVIDEAVVCGVPVLCSKIAGNIGMLGPEYEAYFTPRDAAELTEKLRLFENEERLREHLRRHIIGLQSRFAPEAEDAAWAALLTALQVQ